MLERVGVLGSGAIGSVIGGYLTRAGNDVTLIDAWPEHVDTMKRDGLTVTAQDEKFTVPVNAIHVGEVCNIAEPFDAVFISLKSYDTVWGTHLVLPHLKPTGVMVSAQNAINDERIARIAGFTRSMPCVVTIGAGLYEPGHVTRTSIPDRLAFKVGELNGMPTQRAERLADMLGAVGITQVTKNPWGERWAKLATNSMANPICGITGLGSGEARQTSGVVDVMIGIAAEVVAVGSALGVQVEPINGGTGGEVRSGGGRPGAGGDQVHPVGRRDRSWGGSAFDAPGRAEGPPDRDRLPQRVRRREGQGSGCPDASVRGGHLGHPRRGERPPQARGIQHSTSPGHPLNAGLRGGTNNRESGVRG